jgi:hypothetical protein
MWGQRLDRPWSKIGTFSGICEYTDENWGPIKSRKFLGQL